MKSHGHTRNGHWSPEYKTWACMIARCENSKAINFARYGGKGIRVCERWRKSFAAFFEDMGPRLAGMQLDRIDSNGHYEPGNCRWVTIQEQNTNRSQVIFIAIDGLSLSVAEWCRRRNVNAKSVYTRISRGMEPIKALTLPIEISKSRRRTKMNTDELALLTEIEECEAKIAPESSAGFLD